MANLERPRRHVVYVGLRMPSALHKQLVKYAKHQKQPVSEALRDLLEKGLGQ